MRFQRLTVIRSFPASTRWGSVKTSGITSLFALLLLLAPPVALHAQFSIATNNGTITITGYTGVGGDITIPDSTNGLPVTAIKEGAFIGLTSLASVSIPGTVTNIGLDAFRGCSGLTAIIVDSQNSTYSSTNGVLFDKNQTALVSCPGGLAGNYTVPSGVTSIGQDAFAVCVNLTGVGIPGAVTNLGVGVFSFCLNLADVAIPGSISNIPMNAFEDCVRLTNATIADGVTSIDDDAFYDCASLAGVGIANTVSNIGSYSFAECASLAAVNIPDAVTGIGTYAFRDCYALTNATIGNHVTNIGDYAFNYCSNLPCIVIPDSVTSLGNYAFQGCFALGNVLIPGTITNFGNWSFDHCTSLTNVTIADGVTSIGQGAFAFCSGLSIIVIPRTVTNLGQYAFYDCTALTGAYLLGDVPGVDLTVFSGDSQATAYHLSGASGWTGMFGGRATALWNPQFQAGGAGFGAPANQFAFTISGNSGLTVIVEATVGLASPAWSPVGTNFLTGGSSRFTDPAPTNFPARFYRLRLP
jgi:hypothetical protein